MGSSGEREWNFRFNNVDFSDRVLRLEIMPSNTGEGSNTSEDGVSDSKPKKIHINSLMLAYKSQFFYKLFKNGMKETQQGDEVALKIDESEEAAFMDVLKFIYDHSVNASSASDLVDVLMAADKFEVTSCITFCVELLLKLPMSTELALVCLGLPPSVLADEVVQTLIESTKRYICDYYRDFTEYEEELMGLPLCAVEVIIASDGLQVDSEDDVFDFILEWGRRCYPELEERREILTRLLVSSICLPKMSSLKLKEVLDCSDFDFEEVWKPVVDALVSKDQDLPPTTKCEYPRRIYNHRVVKVVQFQLARPQCVVYFDLTKEECADLVSPKQLYSQTFFLGGEGLRLLAQCTEEKRTLGLFVCKTGAGSETCTLDFHFSTMKKPSKEFTFLVKSINSIVQSGLGFKDLFKTPWEKLMSEESEYFIDGILHLRVDITLLS